jgi:hypothetical protein
MITPPHDFECSRETLVGEVHCFEDGQGVEALDFHIVRVSLG